jgi:DNA-binding MarR family transcriptional regulator
MNNNNKTINRMIPLIFNTSRLIHEQSKGKKDHPDPFSVLRLETLRYVAEKENPSMKGVADHFYITPSSATSLINPLVKTKMLKRVVDKNDRRVTHLSITSKGRKNLNEGFNKINSRMRKILIKLSTKEQESLIKILEKLSKIYDKSN